MSQASRDDPPATQVSAPRWDVVDYATAVAVLTQLSRTPTLADPPDPLTSHLLNLDGERHRALRSKIVTALDLSASSIIPLVRPTAAMLLETIEGDTDMAGAFVRPLVLTLMDRLLGLTDGGQADLRWWHEAALALETEFAADAPTRIRGRLADLINGRRRAPRSDLISRLVADETIASDELESTIFFAFSAGYVNTVNFLGRSLLALASNPAEYRWLCANPGAVTGAVEELLRYAEPPGRASMRVAATDTVVGDRTVVAGTIVHIYRAHASRDAARYPEPERLNLQSRGPTSLAFGAGAHFCPGANVVRVIADLAVLTLIEHVEALDTVDRTNLAWDFADELTLLVSPRDPMSGNHTTALGRIPSVLIEPPPEETL